MGMFFRPNHVSRFVSSCFRFPSVTFGHLTFCVTFALSSVEYGCIDQASNLSFLFAFATSSANLPGEWLSCAAPGLGLSRPRGDVSPIPTSAFEFPALKPL